MSDQSKIEKEFWKYYEIGSSMPPQTADNMLIAYSFYKQATEGDNDQKRPEESSNVVQTFKHDAWLRLKGTPKEVAMQKYTETIKRLIAETAEEDRLPEDFSSINS